MAIAVSSCGTSNEGVVYRVSSDSRGPTIRAVDSTVLSVPDSTPLGATTALARASDGRLFLSDLAGGRILQFSSVGALQSMIGKHGDGPGEFQMPGSIVLLGHDSVLAVVDPRRQYVSLMDAATGRFLHGLKAPFQIAGQMWSVSHDTAYFAVFPNSHLWAQWSWRSDSISLAGAFPPELAEAANIVALYGWPEVIPAGSRMLATVPTDPGLRVYRTDGTLEGLVMIPAARRRGDPPGLLKEHQKLEAAGSEFKYLGSSPAGIFMLPSGDFGILNVDVNRIARGRGMEYQIAGYFLSVIKKDLTQACVDAAVPFESEAISIPLGVGSSIYMLSQRVTPEGGVRAVLYHFDASTTDCDWVPTGGVRPAVQQAQ